MSKKRNNRIITDPSIRYHEHSFQQSINQYPSVLKKSTSKPNTHLFRQGLTHLCTPSKKTFNTLDNQNQNATITAFRQKLAHKNDYIFRGSFNPNDTSILPFMTSLRSQQYQSKKFKTNSESKPPNVAFKTTMNQKFMKTINDIEAQEKRISQIYYRWHNKSGTAVKRAVEFECSLRNYKNTKNPEALFDNQIRPIKYKNVEQKIYKMQEVFCPKQMKIFKVK